MCNQTVSLIAAELERRGIATVVLQLLREAVEKVRPPRALFVPFRHGFPLDKPGDPARQAAVLKRHCGFSKIPARSPALADYRLPELDLDV
jgi:hypothetical protein